MFISHAFNSTITKGASVQLVFGFEYAILLTIVVNTVVKYILNSIDLHSENPWEGKAVCLLYSELILGFIKVCIRIVAPISKEHSLKSVFIRHLENNPIGFIFRYCSMSSLS